MKIGFDAKRAFLNFTGLGNYSRNVIKALLNHTSGNGYFLYTPDSSLPEQMNFIKTYGNIEIKTPYGIIDRNFKSYWRSFKLAKYIAEDKLDVYHGLSAELPVGIEKTGIKTVVTIPDLIFLRFPRLYRFVDRKIYMKKVQHACKVADKIIAISEQTKADIIEFLHIAENRITSIYHPCGEIFLREYDEETHKKVKDKYQLPDNYILNVGTIEERKNLVGLLKAFYGVKKRNDIKLVVVGRETAYIANVKHTIEKYKLEKDVIFINDVTGHYLAVIFQQSKLFVYPSFFEGFGIPVIEALYSKIPVITSNSSCLSEAGGPGSLYIDPYDIDEMQNAMEKVLSNNDLCDKMVISGLQYVKRFDAEKIANDLITVYEHL